MQAYFHALNKFIDFSGRAGRIEYWSFVLINIALGLLVICLDSIFGVTLKNIGLGPLSGIYAICTFLPYLAAMVRRMHDTNRNGWWLLLIFIPIIGFIVVIIFLLLKGDKGKNDYGPSPLESQPTLNQLELTGRSKELTLKVLSITFIVINIFYGIMNKFADGLYKKDWYAGLVSLTSTLNDAIPLLLALLIKDKTWRTVLFIIAALYFMYSCYYSSELLVTRQNHR